MKIADRYVVWEMIPLFLVGIAGFIMILTVDLIFTFTDLIINKGIPAWAVVQLIIFKLPSLLVLTLPVSTLFATTMTLGRLGKDNEITALRTSGVSLLRISAPILIFAALVSVLSFANNELIVPEANHTSENIIRQIFLKQPLPNIRENIFFKDLGERYFYIKKVDAQNNRMEDIMIYELGSDTYPRVMIAKKAGWADRVWTLKDGLIHKFDNSGYITYETKFSDLKILVSENILNFSSQKTPGEMNSRELVGLITMLKKGGVQTQVLQVDFLMKFSIPIVSLSLPWWEFP